jgi:gliding motility-associated-like protein
MDYRRFLFFFCFIFLGLKAFPAVFMVTSSADSGPGTLREALAFALANGISQTDSIRFNLSDLSESGRTITLLSELPAVTSNLVIDGTSQPGPVFGISGAKVALYFNAPLKQNFSGLRITKQFNITILGLFIKNLADYSTFKTPIPPAGIEVESSDNVQIGDVNKGNVISGFNMAVSVNTLDSSQSSSNLTMKSNFFGIEPDGATVSGIRNNGAVIIYNVFNNVTLGGTVNEGNLFGAGVSILYNIYNRTSQVLIQNNKIDVNYNVSNSLPNGSGVVVEGFIAPMDANINIADNMICNQFGFSAIFCTNISGSINVVRNYIGTDKNRQKLTTSFYGIYVTESNQLQVGSTNTSDANYIGYCFPVYTSNNKKTGINKNSMFCSTLHVPIYNDTHGQSHTQCNILKIGVNSLSGTATPNSVVELFYSDQCNTCSPQTYFASVNADANGNWVYNGPIIHTIIASATLNGFTSEFSRTGAIIDNLKILNACNDGLGSIVGAIPTSATIVQWVDINGNVVGTSADLLNVQLGKYKLMVQDGDCSGETDYFEIKKKFIVDTTNVKTMDAFCDNLVGSVSGVTIVNNDDNPPATIWYDSNGKVVGTSLNLQNVPSGHYFLLVKSADSTCSRQYGPFILKDVTDPAGIPPPLLTTVQLCSPGEAFLRVKNPLPGYTYRLYSSANSVTPIDEQPSGVFKILVTANTSLFVTQVTGTCESARTEADIGIHFSSRNIANTFTPNGDGINDYWEIAGIENYPGAIVQVFDRFGQKVFESKGYSQPFDGVSNGKILPPGAYYYIINLAANCRLVSGYLTIVR